MDQDETFAIRLSADDARTLQALVDIGTYGSPSEVVGAALQTLARDEAEHQAKLSDIRRRIQEAIDDPRPSIPLDEVIRRLRARIDATEAAGDDAA